MKAKISTIVLSLILIFNSTISNAGEVYLVLGSDTAIWDGMGTNRYNNDYDPELYTDPSMNAYIVMDPAFRAPLVDSYGTPMKMTWWMMAGNIFRYAVNTDMPIPNIMTMYLMKKYHGDNVIANGDELSLHYHTFYWSDYDNDGIFYWNQSLTFLECLDDFNFTLAQFLIDEQVFPVSFRSGWHYMDNDWQHYLDEKVLPYSMHNAWPSKRTDLTEPLDNTYDWSLSPSVFVPFHPSIANYQIPGDGPGWNVRSNHFNTVRSADLMDDVFAASANGTDQVACFWGHLPETDFASNMVILDSLAHRAAANYPSVNFRYCTGIEAMQLWRQSTDSIAPTIQFSEIQNGDYVTFNIQTDEPIFQTQPFVAVKDIYEQYVVLECIPNGNNEWETTQPVLFASLAKAAVALCDSMGNQSMEFMDFLPDDEFIDNIDAGYTEIYGGWQSHSEFSWGVDSRGVSISQTDSAIAQWNYNIPQSTQYNIFVQIPERSDAPDYITYTIFNDLAPVDTIEFNTGVPTFEWVYLSTVNGQAGSVLIVEVKAKGNNQPGTVLAADVIRITPLVRDRYLYLARENIDFGGVSVEDTITFDMAIRNLGIQNLQIQNIHSLLNLIDVQNTLPLTIPAMGVDTITLEFSSATIGSATDTLIIESDDPVFPIKKIPAYAEVMNFFAIIDNEDLSNYEEFGTWHTSVAQAYGPSSRYASLNSSPLPSARFYLTLDKAGLYEISEIVPRTVNSTDDALYQFRIDGIPVDSVYINQNTGSGGWVSLGQQTFPANVEVEVRVIDTGNSTVGPVIRADAVKFSLIQEVSVIDDQLDKNLPTQYKLSQNYPNPFNPTTKINFQLPEKELVKIDVFNALGERVKTLINSEYSAGYHSIQWNGTDRNGGTISSGVYFYQMQAGEYITTKKMIYLR
jgi:flagellar hook capping protein FlgD